MSASSPSWLRRFPTRSTLSYSTLNAKVAQLPATLSHARQSVSGFFFLLTMIYCYLAASKHIYQ